MINDRLKDWNILLGSRSPRRKFLMEQLGLRFTILDTNHEDEDYPAYLAFDEIPVYLARKKAESLLEHIREKSILITADTIVWCNGEVLGKPDDFDDAVNILEKLSGRSHTVVTGLCLTGQNKQSTSRVLTDVFFKPLDIDEINYYISTFKPFDKAGAYGIQEWIGYIGIEKINGSFYNVMGLPVQKLYLELLKYTDSATP